MAESNVISLAPFVVTVDVLLELYLITMEITLCFGPFNSKEAAFEWSNVFEQEHKEIEVQEDLQEHRDEEMGLSSMSYVRAFVHGVDIIQGEVEAREKGVLIVPNQPIVDAHQVHLYALQGFQAAITDALEYINEKEDGN